MVINAITVHYLFQILNPTVKTWSEGSKKAKKQAREQDRKEGSKEARKERSKEARHQGNKVARNHFTLDAYHDNQATLSTKAL